jgi:hypothetical protein
MGSWMTNWFQSWLFAALCFHMNDPTALLRSHYIGPTPFMMILPLAGLRSLPRHRLKRRA